MALRALGADALVADVFTIMFAMPVGSIASSFARMMGRDGTLPAKGTVLSTLASFHRDTPAVAVDGADIAGAAGLRAILPAPQGRTSRTPHRRIISKVVVTATPIALQASGILTRLRPIGADTS